MVDNGLDPTALPQRPASDPTAYASAHLFETHDVWHVVTGFDTDIPGEVRLQAFYLAQVPTRLPPLLLAASFLNAVFYGLDEVGAGMDASSGAGGWGGPRGPCSPFAGQRCGTDRWRRCGPPSVSPHLDAGHRPRTQTSGRIIRLSIKSGGGPVHHSGFSSVIIDCPTSDLTGAAKFWSQAFGRPAVEQDPVNPSYVSLKMHADEVICQVQSVAHESRVHLDLETDDIDAEVARLVKLGARAVEHNTRHGSSWRRRRGNDSA